MPIRASQGDYEIDTDPDRFDLEVIHGFLTESYWAHGISRDSVRRSIQHSYAFAIYHRPTGSQVGFARVITDRTTFGYLADVFVLEPHRGRGLARWLVKIILDDPDLQGFRRWMLATRDAHAVYAANGFTPLPVPERYMQRVPEPAR